MDKIEKNLENSFRRVKEDIMSLQAHLLELSGKQAEIIELIEDLRKKMGNKKKTSKKRK